MTTRFAEQFRKVYVLKSPDVEEWIDIVWHRPLAAVVAVVLLPTRISPNMVTLWSFIAGIAATYVLYESVVSGVRELRIWAGVLAFLSVILDCVDGQLARARGGGSRWGRILDGLVDFTVLAVIYGVVTYESYLIYGWKGAAVGAFVSVSGAIQVGMYDKLKSIYLSYVQPSASDGGESLDEAERQWEQAKASGNTFEKIGMFIYVRVLLNIQDKITPAPRDVPTFTDEQVVQFRDRHIDGVRAFTLLGLGTHMAFVYTGIILSTWLPQTINAMHFLCAVPFNLLLIYSIMKTAPMRRGEFA